MENKAIISNLFQNNELLNLEFITKFFDDAVVFEWQSSQAVTFFNKEDILKFSTELKRNFEVINNDVKYLIEEDSKVCIAYNQFVTTIENTKDFQLIGKFIAIFEFQEGKILKGYQISKPE